MKGFSIGEAVKYGWETFRKNWAFFIGVFFLYLFIPFIFWTIARYFQQSYPLISGIFFVFYYILGLILSMGLIAIGLKYSAGQEAEIKDLFTSGRNIVKYFFSAILYSLIVMVGFLLLIIPGLIWMTKFVFFGWFVIDKGAGPIEALQLSSEATMGAKWDVFGLIVVTILLSFIGILSLGVGYLVAAPVSILATAFAYRKLVAQTESIS